MSSLSDEHVAAVAAAYATIAAIAATRDPTADIIDITSGGAIAEICAFCQNNSRKKLKYITISINKRKQYISEDINIITDYFKDHKEFFTTCTIHKIIDIEFSVDLDILI